MCDFHKVVDSKISCLEVPERTRNIYKHLKEEKLLDLMTEMKLE